MTILVLCGGNSARSILLESLLNHHGAGRARAFSAGSQPAGPVNPHAVALLKREGHATSGFRSKSWDEFGTPLRAPWGVEDPAAVPDDQAPAAFDEAYAILPRRAAAFLAAPVETMDPARLGAHLKTCGTIA